MQEQFSATSRASATTTQHVTSALHGMKAGTAFNCSNRASGVALSSQPWRYLHSQQFVCRHVLHDMYPNVGDHTLLKVALHCAYQDQTVGPEMPSCPTQRSGSKHQSQAVVQTARIVKCKACSKRGDRKAGLRNLRAVRVKRLANPLLRSPNHLWMYGWMTGCVHVCMPVCVHVCMSCMCVCAYACVCVCMHFLRVCVCVCVFVCVCTF